MFTLSYPGSRRAVLTIHPGEYLVSGDDVLIATVLGSCVSVSLYDPGAPWAGSTISCCRNP